MYSQPSDLRQANERTVVDVLRGRGPLSRAGLARATGLSAVTMGKVVDGLLGDGILEECEPPSGPGASGRPARPVRLETGAPAVVAIELGVVRTALRALPVAGAADETWDVTFETPRRLRTWISRLREARDALPGTARAVAISVPGIVDEEQGRVLFSPNLHWTNDVDLTAALAEVWDAPACIVQEANALALGHLGAEPSSDSFLLVEIGDGVGSGIVTRRSLFRGELPLKGELGHTPVPGNDRSCGCGGTGCLETLVSRTGLLESAGNGADWRAFSKKLDVRDLPVWFRDTLDRTAATIAGAVNVLGLPEVVVTGSLAELGDEVIEYLSGALQRSALWGRFGEVVCRAAPSRRAHGLGMAALDRVLLPEPRREPLRRTS